MLAVLLASVGFVQSQTPLNDFSVHFNGTDTTFSWISTNLSYSMDKFHFSLERSYNNGQWGYIQSLDFPINVTNYSVILVPYADYKACINAFNNTWSSEPKCIMFEVSSGTPSASSVDIDIINTTMVHAFWNLKGQTFMTNLFNSTHNITYSTNKSFVMFPNLSPNSSYTLRVCSVEQHNSSIHHICDDNMTISWRMPFSAPPMPSTPLVYVSPFEVEIRVMLAPVSDVNGYIRQYILHVNIHTSYDDTHVDMHYDVYLEHFTENTTLEMSNYIALNNKSSYQFVLEAQNAVQLYKHSKPSDCVTLSDDEPECSHSTKTTVNRNKLSLTSVVIGIIVFVMIIGIVIFLGTLGIKSIMTSKDNKVNSVSTFDDTNVISYTNPAFGMDSPDYFISTHEIYEDDIQSDTIPGDIIENFDINEYVDV